MISIHMPTVRTTFIREAVEAIINQTYQDWELIIKDGGDGHVIDLLDGLDLSKVKIVWSQDRGITDAMNQAMRMSTGEIMMWANDDDRLEPDALETIARENRNCWGFGKIKDSNGGEHGHNGDLGELLRRNFIPQPTAFWQRWMYEDIGEMSENEDLVSDYEYWIRLMKRWRPVFIDKILSFYRIHPGMTTRLQLTEQLRQAEKVRRENALNSDRI